MAEGGGGGGVRLHVGGLGESVGKDDLLKIFSPMGSVDSVEFVRTKGRSFAYIDFSPSSENSLTKLFSTYNGCVWKGGRLRLEKAKEHYLARLKREWEESSSSKSDDTVVEVPDDSIPPPTHLNIFVPKLRKVKAMPLSGTGKHKYSFQRVAVSSLLPKSICDCEEHSPSLTPQENHLRDLEALNAGINEEEVNIMNSVMNKLFEKNNISKNEQVPEQVPEQEESEVEEDQDNLIINVVSKGKDVMKSELDLLSRKRKSILSETTSTGEGRKENHIHPNKKRQSEGSGREESSQAIREKKKPSEVVPEKPSDEPSRVKGVKQSNENIAWSQKSSWKALMANGNSGSFSVSSVLPDVGSSKTVQPAVSNTDTEWPWPTVKTKIKKKKSKRLTSTVMAGNLPLEDEIERNDATVTDDVGSDQDAVTDTFVEAEPIEPVSSTEGDSENDNLDVEAAENVAEDSDAEEENLVLENDDDEPLEPVSSTEGDSENDNLDVEADENVAEDSDAEEENLVLENDDDEPLEPVSSTEGDSENENLNMEEDENVVEDFGEEKESLVLEDDEEEPGKGPLEACSKSTEGSSWTQRASWTQLVSENSSSFSLTQLFPDSNSDKCEAAKAINDENMKQGANTSTNGFEDVGVHVLDSTPVRSLEENRQSLKRKNVTAGSRLAVKKPIRRTIGSGETCTFMRSDASLREWKKAKEAVSRTRKKSEEAINEPKRWK